MDLDLEVEIKEEPVWLEGTANTSLENFECVTEVIPVKQETKSELTEPGPTQENSFQPSADKKEEISIEQRTVDQLDSNIKEENNLETAAVLAVHSGEGVHRCMVCSMMFPEEFNLRKHLLIHSCDSRAFHCEVSDGSSAKQCQNTNHLVSRSRRQYDCRICNKIFTHRCKLVTHMYVHSGERPFRCAECSSTFARKNSLKVHMATHSTERPFRCEQCNRAFIRRDNLLVHMVKHSEETPYHCDECNRTFNQQSHLDNHKMMHSRGKVYHCNECSHTYTRKGSLRDHMVTHTGERLHFCKDCDRRFVRRSSLNRHMRVYSEKGPFCCLVCKSMFTQKCSLKRHMLSHTLKDFCI